MNKCYDLLKSAQTRHYPLNVKLICQKIRDKIENCINLYKLFLSFFMEIWSEKVVFEIIHYTLNLRFLAQSVKIPGNNFAFYSGWQFTSVSPCSRFKKVNIFCKNESPVDPCCWVSLRWDCSSCPSPPSLHIRQDMEHHLQDQLHQEAWETIYLLLLLLSVRLGALLPGLH